MTEPRKIVLIGTNHHYQKLGPPFYLEDPEDIRLEHAQDFQRYLLEVCPQYGIKTVAEEMNQQALDEAKEKWKTRKKVLERKDPRVWLPDDLEGNKAKLKRCEEALEWHERGMSIPQRVAKELSLKPLLCDPNRGQRTKLGIFEENDLKIQSFLNSNPPMPEDEIQRQVLEGYRKRERYWFEQLQQEVSESKYPVLFICGKKHVDTFSKLLEEKDFNVICICKDWKPSIPTESK